MTNKKPTTKKKVTKEKIDKKPIDKLLTKKKSKKAKSAKSKKTQPFAWISESTDESYKFMGSYADNNDAGELTDSLQQEVDNMNDKIVDNEGELHKAIPSASDDFLDDKINEEEYKYEMNYDSCKDRFGRAEVSTMPQFIIDIKNISYTDKTVRLFDHNYSDEDVRISSVFTHITYKEIVEFVKVNKYDLDCIYIQIISGDEKHILSKLSRTRLISKNISGQMLDMPLAFAVDRFQFQGGIVVKNMGNDNLVLTSGTYIDIVMHPNSFIQVRFLIEENN